MVHKLNDKYYGKRGGICGLPKVEKLSESTPLVCLACRLEKKALLNRVVGDRERERAQQRLIWLSSGVMHKRLI